MTVKLSKVTLFEGKTPEALQRQIKALEDNTGDAVRRLDGSFLPNFAVTRRETHCRVSVGEFVVANTASADITATLPVSTPQNAGRCCALMKTSASFTLTAAVTEGTVSGSVSDLLGTAGSLYLFVSDGAGGWWRTL